MFIYNMFEEAKDVSEVRFGLLSTTDITQLSVVEITNSRLSTADKMHTVYDTRMGPMNPSEICPTCKCKTVQCPGHFGHIVLHTPIVHPLHYKRVAQVLQCVCIQCSRLLVSEEHLRLWNVLRYRKEARFAAIHTRILRVRLCTHCNLSQPDIQFAALDHTYYLSYSARPVPGEEPAAKLPLRTEEIKKIFNHLSDSDVELLGFSATRTHPRNLLLEVLPVLPPRARPYIMTENRICDDDLTWQFNEVVKSNNHLASPGLSEARREKHLQSLIFWIKTLFDNSKGLAKHNNSKPMKGIKERLSSKDGLIRSHIMGKRCNQSARTVIGPDPTLRVDQIAIPHEIADILTYPERVHALNIDAMQQLVWDNRANYVHRGNKKFVLEYALSGDKRYNFRLQLGDVVDRKLVDGDVVIVNRQPSLHKGSMMAQHIVRRSGKTIRLNLAVTASFNADFDGDEMNIFVPSSEQSKAELQVLAGIHNHVVGVQASKSNLTIVQDCLLGTYLMTSWQDVLPRDEFFQMCMSIEGFTWELLQQKLQDSERVQGVVAQYTGKLLFSLLLPRDFIYGYGDVRIEAGILVEGSITKKQLGSAHTSIIRLLHKEYPAHVCIDFINNVQFVALAFIMFHGFSVGIADCLTDRQEDIRQVVARAFVEAEGFELNTQDPGVREAKVSLALGKARDVGMRLAKESLSRHNRFMDTVTSGSKGDAFNITQIMGLLGQQNVTGRRIKPSISKGTRVLPHYSLTGMSKSEEYASRGFVEHSFMQGLSPQEFWNHAATGREGITDTSMKTSTSGYLQRKMVKLMEDVKVEYDGTVRNAVGSVIQFAYGGDGLDGTQTVVSSDGIPQVCDVNRIVNRLNLLHELG
jgi:DNA-directed RNA polymerase beta' subunit